MINISDIPANMPVNLDLGFLALVGVLAVAFFALGARNKSIFASSVATRASNKAANLEARVLELEYETGLKERPDEDDIPKFGAI